MKNRLITLIILSFSLVMPSILIGGQAAAVNIFNDTCTQTATPTGQKTESGTDVCQDVKTQQASGASPIIKILKEAIGFISYIIGAAAIIGIVVSGLRFMTASGDPQSIASARTGLIYSLVGIAIAALAQVIVIFVLDQVS